LVKTDVGGYRVNEIVKKIAEVTGLTEDTLREYIPRAYKQVEQTRDQSPRIPASERIEHELGSDFVERHRKEALEQETPKIREQTKKELLQDTSFIADVTSNAPEILKEIPKNEEPQRPYVF